MSKKMKLFCLPFAGGFSSMFLQWCEYFNDQIELVPIELAGRGSRLQEPLYVDLKQAVNDVYRIVKKDIDVGPYAFFGHSLGAQLAYELYYKIRLHGHRSPLAMFLSGHNPPHISPATLKHQLSEEEMKQELLKMGGTDPEMFQDEKLLQLFLPILYSDFKMSETHQHKPRKQLIDCDLIILNGKEDPVTSHNALLEWQNYTNKALQLREFEGGHFYIHEHTEEVTNFINNFLLQGGQR